MAAPSHRVDPNKLKSIRVLYDDDFVVAVSKPSGMSVHGGAGEPGPTLIEILGRATSAELHLVHRLDRGTSGAMLLAKSSSLASALSRTWNEASKIYWAIATGVWKGPRDLKIPLEDSKGRIQHAHSRVRRLTVLDAMAPTASLLEIELETGRTHQIRRHLAAVGHPVLMDRQHGNFAFNREWSSNLARICGRKPKELMLHSRTIRWKHPVSSAVITTLADPPEPWIAILRAQKPALDDILQVP